MHDPDNFSRLLDHAKPVKILLVEDNTTDTELCLRALKRHNLANDLAWVKDGAEALDFLFRRGQYSGMSNNLRPKIVLLDLRLPKVDGMEVLRQLKADPRTRSIPVAVLTSSQEDRDLVECYHLGVNSYIPKPVEFEAFVQTVSELGYYWLLINKVPETVPHLASDTIEALAEQPEGVSRL